MTIRNAAFGLTVAAVVVLLVSLVLGVDRPAGEAPEEVLVHPGTPRLDDRVRVEVLNGAGIAGLARAVTEELRAEGFDVVYYGNAPAHRDSTTVLDRTGNSAAAAAVSAALGVDRIETAVDTTLYLEVTVVLGGDYSSEEGSGNRE